MGFKQTCAMSQFPISDGDAVVCILLAPHTGYRTPSHDGYTNSAAVWAPISLPFAGVNGDRGYVIPAENLVADLPLRQVVGKSVAEVLDTWQDDRKPVEVKIGRDSFQLKLVMIHQDIWDRFSSMPMSRIDKHLSIDAEIAAIPAALAFWEAETQEHLSMLPADRIPPVDLSSDPYMAWISAKKEPREPKALLTFASFPGGPHHALRLGLAKTVSDCLANGERDTAEALIEAGLKLTIFHESMNRLRKLWSPPTGLGDDSMNLELHETLSKMVLGKIQDYRQEFDLDVSEDVGAPSPGR